ncbi:hypothetical protein NL676_038881 [Syzygium grande]|nr:hypothetical protein NL676_038881 [Syzygium grande]
MMATLIATAAVASSSVAIRPFPLPQALLHARRDQVLRRRGPRDLPAEGRRRGLVDCVVVGGGISGLCIA